MTRAMVPSDREGLVLRAVEVTRSFGDVRALKGVSLTVERGQILGLVGPDGAGKTTLLRSLAGLIGIDSGTVTVLGRDPLRDSTLRDMMGVMPQHYSLYGDLSVEENLRFFAELYCLPRKTYRERRERLLALTRLAPFTARRADALSGGMYKKLALACALLHEPQILLLDEPTNGVDPVSRRELWQLLHEFASAGMAMLISTAYMDEAERCHRVGLLYQGRMVADGTPHELIRGLSTPVLELRGGDRDALERRLAGFPGVIAVSPAGARLRVVIEAAVETSLQRAVAEFGARLEHVGADFEDVFLVYAHQAAPAGHGPQIEESAA